MEPSKDDDNQSPSSLNAENTNALIIVEKQETNSESIQKSPSALNNVIFYFEN